MTEAVVAGAVGGLVVALLVRLWAAPFTRSTLPRFVYEVPVDRRHNMPDLRVWRRERRLALPPVEESAAAIMAAHQTLAQNFSRSADGGLAAPKAGPGGRDAAGR